MAHRLAATLAAALVLTGCASARATMPPASDAAARMVDACTALGTAPDDVTCTGPWTLGYSDTWAEYLGNADRRSPEAIAASLSTYTGVQLAAYDAGVQYARSVQR